jgi:hypothetical protein
VEGLWDAGAVPRPLESQSRWIPQKQKGAGIFVQGLPTQAQGYRRKLRPQEVCLVGVAQILLALKIKLAPQSPELKNFSHEMKIF